jgi:hypothetical protein
MAIYPHGQSLRLLRERQAQIAQMYEDGTIDALRKHNLRFPITRAEQTAAWWYFGTPRPWESK